MIGHRKRTSGGGGVSASSTSGGAAAAAASNASSVGPSAAVGDDHVALAKKYFASLNTATIRDEEDRLYSEILDIKWSPVGNRVAYSRHTKSLLVCDFSGASMNSFSKHHIIKNCHRDAIGSLSWDPNNDVTIATVGGDNLKIWNIETQKLTMEFPIKGNTKLVSYSPRGKYLSCISKLIDKESGSVTTHHLTVIDMESKDLKVVAEASFDYFIFSFVWANDDGSIVLGFSNGEVGIFKVNEELANGLENVYTFKASVSCINAMAFDPSGQYLIIGSHEGIVSVWSTASLSCVKTVALVDESVMAIDISGDGRYVAACFQGGAPTRIYELKTFTECFEVTNNKSSGYQIANIAFRGRQATFAYTSNNGELKLCFK
ncbi:Tex1 protein [Saccharomycopsis crataegensis]|uniref:Tex1 protein n=1 Tax=Saccharomycopsis crataegensis TaxID=43959 RepID=A0AAV5QT59_9ASCO|nr:Tex1 protein [Saccharomycopsis crataegensis]